VLAEIDAAQRRLYADAAPGVVFLVTPNSIGSGILLTAEGLVLTNAHVVGKSNSLDVVTFSGQRMKGHVVERGVGLDLAVVQLEGVSGLPTLQPAPASDLAVGQWVAAVGHGEGGGWTFTTGTISNLYTTQEGTTIFQTQIPLNPGNSGGPILDRQGRVVGVATASLEGAQNLNFGIRTDVAMLGLTHLEPLCGCLVVDAPPGVPVFVDGQMVGMGPRIAVTGTIGEHEVFAIIGGQKVRQVIQWPAQRVVKLAN